VVCSLAKRARATAKPLIVVLGCPVRYDEEMYGADADDLLVITRQLLASTSSVMFVGHNPSLEDFTAMLCGSSPRYPTGALGTLSLGVAHWSRTGPGCATLAALDTPAQLAEGPTEPRPGLPEP
jgi:phosphohistidine phosphatase